MHHRAAVVTCSDRAHAGLYRDESGPLIVAGLAEAGFEVGEPVVVPDDREAIVDAVTSAVGGGSRVVLTTGGTGVGPRDVTVDALAGLLDFELPGIPEAIRRAGPQPHAMLSRGLAGVLTVDGTRALLVCAPGSPGGARDVVAVVGPALAHVVAQLDGSAH